MCIDYLALLSEEAERNIAYDPDSIVRFNVSSATQVLLLSERNEHLSLDAVMRGFATGKRDKSPFINARVETAAISRILRPLWQHVNATYLAGEWFEWKEERKRQKAASFHKPC